MNRHLRDLVSALSTRYSIDSEEMPMSDWICANTTLKGKPFNFNKFPFQKRIADDMTPGMVVKKCSQVGLTEIELRKTVGLAYRNQGLHLGFSLPDKKLRDVAYDSRMSPIIDAQPIFNLEGQKQTRSREIIQIGTSFIYMLMANESSATSIPLDALFVDEVDLSDQSVLALFDSRLQASDLKLRQDFSTPTFDGYGIDASYQVSDQHEYMVRCGSCGHTQVPDFDPQFIDIPGFKNDKDLMEINEADLPNMDLDNAKVVCEKCRTPLDLSDTENRFWVPAYPSAGVRGYRVRPFTVSTIPVGYIVMKLISYKRRDFVRGFCNTVLGRSYADSNTRIPLSAINSAFETSTPHTNLKPGDDVAIGIDVGNVCHVVIGGLTKDYQTPAYKFELVKASELVDYVEKLCLKYNVITGAIDRHPYTPTANQVFKVSKGKIWPIAYGTNALIKEKEPDSDNPYIEANRTSVLDAVSLSLRQGLLPMYGYGSYRSMILEHLRDMVRDEQPEKPAVWRKLRGNDHFFHALGYLKLSAKILKHFRESMVEDELHTQVIVSNVSLKGERSGIVDPNGYIYQRIGQ